MTFSPEHQLEPEPDTRSRPSPALRSEQRATVAVERLLDDSVLTARLIRRGFGHANVHVRLASGTQAIVKFPRWSRPDKHRHAIAMLERLRTHGVRLPAVLAEDLERGIAPEPVVILSYLPGEALSDVYPTLSFHEREKVGSELGELRAIIHAVRIPDLCQGSLSLTELERRTRRARESGLISKDQVKLAAAIVEEVASARMEQPACVIHGDVYPDNIIVARSPGERHLAGLIDFDHVDHDDPARDFVKLRWWVFEPLSDLVDPILSGYLRAGGDPDAASPASHRFMAAALLETMAGIIYFTERNNPHDNHMAVDFRRRFEHLIGVVGGI